MQPLVLHLDIDAFFASVEQLRNPRLEGRPVAVGSGVVASASYEARRFGIQAGTTLREARRQCPELVILAGHAPLYRCFSERVFELCGASTPSLETYLDEAYADWSGMERLYPDPVAAAERLRARIRAEVGLRVTVGLGRNKMFAKMASKSAKPDGLRRIAPGEEEAFLRPLAVRTLPGVGPRTERLLHKLNIHTVEELRLLSRDSLRRMLGAPGAALHERCRGLDTPPVSEREVPRSIRRETSFFEDTIDPVVIEGTLYYLTERAANTLRSLGLEARHVGVKLRYSSGALPAGDYPTGGYPTGGSSTGSAAGGGAVTGGAPARDAPPRDGEEAVRKLERPTSRDSIIFAQARALLRSLHTRRAALRLVGVSLSGLVRDPLRGRSGAVTSATVSSGAVTSGIDGRWRQLELWDGLLPAPAGEDPGERRLLDQLDAVRRRYGFSSVVCGGSLHLLGKLRQDDHGFVLRTSSLTR